jgi:glycosyltransferase involved in cell wall biosynthesis
MTLPFESITALLPVKNGERFLSRLIPSITKMLNDCDDLIIVDDGSTDNSVNIIDEFISSDSRIKLLSTEGIGLVNALNLGIEHSNRNWIARFDVDDEYSANRLFEQRKLMRESIAVIFSDYQIVTGNKISLGRIYSAVLPNASMLSLVSSQRTAHPVALIRRSYLIQSGSYQTEDFPAEDLALWFRLSLFGEVVSSSCLLLFYQLSKGSISAKNRELQSFRRIRILQDYQEWSRWRDRNVETFSEQISTYKSLPFGYHRIFLHLRDFKVLQKTIGIRTPLTPLLRILGYKTLFKMFLPALTISVSVLQRRIYRLTLRNF